MQNMGADKFMNRLFRKADGVVWDLMTGKVGISTSEGIATLAGQGDDAQIEINMVEQFGMEIPAFAQSTPIESVNVGDVIYFGAREKPGWVVEKRYGVKPVGSTKPYRPPQPGSATPTKKAKISTEETIDPSTIDTSNVQFTLMKVDGQRTNWKPPKVSMLGMGDAGVMVLRSLLTMLPGGSAGLQGMQNMMMPLLAMGGGSVDFESMLPLMLMGQMQAPAVTNPDGSVSAAPNPMAQMLPMMLLLQAMKGDGNPFGGKKGGWLGAEAPKSPFRN
jgi:hypothetical protein